MTVQTERKEISIFTDALQVGLYVAVHPAYSDRAVLASLLLGACEPHNLTSGPDVNCCASTVYNISITDGEVDVDVRREKENILHQMSAWRRWKLTLFNIHAMMMIL